MSTILEGYTMLSLMSSTRYQPELTLGVLDARPIFLITICKSVSVKELRAHRPLRPVTSRRIRG